MKNVLLAISGPSGVGKGTIVKELVSTSSDIVPSVSCTTRAPRSGEVDGKDYFFLTKEEFLKKIEEDGFLEYDEHFGNYYGTPKAFVEETLKEKSVILEIDVVGARNAKKVFPETIMMMVVPPSIDELKSRLVGRGTESDQAVKDRIERVEYELSFQNEYDHIIVNDDLTRAVNEIKEIVQKEKSKK